MKFQWLEKYAEQGLIRKEVLASIYSQVDGLLKEGSKADKAQAMKDLATGILGMGAVGGMGVMYGAAKAKLKETAAKSKLLQNREMISAAMKGDEAKARARFDEIAMYAPHVAMNAPLAARLVKAKLQSGLSDDDVQNLSMIQAIHMPDVMKKENFLPKTASVRPEVLGHMVADVFLMSKTAAKKAPEGLLKRLGDMVKHIGLYSAAPVLVGMGVGGANALINKGKEKQLKEQLETSFHKALALSDRDREPLHANKDKARQAFSALAHFAPAVALEPQAARAFMSKIVAFDQGMNISDIKDLSDIQRNLSSAKQPSPFETGFSGAGRYTNAPKMISEAFTSGAENFAEASDG